MNSGKNPNIKLDTRQSDKKQISITHHMNI